MSRTPPPLPPSIRKKVTEPPSDLVMQQKDWDVDSNGFQASNGPTTGYRDGDGGVVETKDFVSGWIPDGWVGNPVNCNNCTGSHATTKYVKVG